MINPKQRSEILAKADAYISKRNTSTSESVCIYYKGEIYDVNVRTGDVKLYTKQWEKDLAAVQSRF